MKRKKKRSLSGNTFSEGIHCALQQLHLYRRHEQGRKDQRGHKWLRGPADSWASPIIDINVVSLLFPVTAKGKRETKSSRHPEPAAEASLSRKERGKNETWICHALRSLVSKPVVSPSAPEKLRKGHENGQQTSGAPFSKSRLAASFFSYDIGVARRSPLFGTELLLQHYTRAGKRTCWIGTRDVHASAAI